MKINKLKLINDVSKALPGISTGNIALEGADSLVFLDSHIYSYNSVISVNVKESEERKLKGVVNAQDFYNCITKLPGDEIDIECDDSTWKIVDGKIKVSMKLLPIESVINRFKSLVTSDEGWMEIDGKNFHDVLNVCFIKGDSSPLNGVYLKGSEAFSTNKFIINKCTLNNEYPEMWLSSSSVTELLKWDNFNSVKLEKQWSHFKSEEGAVFSVRTLALDSYPLDTLLQVLENVFSKKTVAVEILLNENFFNAIKRASAFSNIMEKHDTILISFGKEVKIKGSRLSGNYEEIVEGMTTTFETPVDMNFDLNVFLSSEKFFNNLSILSDSETIDTSEAVHIVLKNDKSMKLFSSITEN